MATFSEALDAMKNNGIVQLPDGSTYCLCSSTELLTDLVSTEVADLIGALSGVIQPVFFKGDSKVIQRIKSHNLDGCRRSTICCGMIGYFLRSKPILVCIRMNTQVDYQ